MIVSSVDEAIEWWTKGFPVIIEDFSLEDSLELVRRQQEIVNTSPRRSAMLPFESDHML